MGWTMTTWTPHCDSSILRTLENMLRAALDAEYAAISGICKSATRGRDQSQKGRSL